MNNDVVVMTDTPETIVTVPIQPVPVIETAKLGVLYHAPLATTLTPGIVQIGAGLLVSAGLVEVDPSIIKIEQITLNGDIVSPDENKSVNLIVDKTTVGLGNVDNTADLDKPVSTATGLALAEKLDIQQNVIEFGKILYIQADGKIGFKTESVEVNKNAFIAVSLNTTTGVLQFTTQNGDTVSVDFPLEELVSDGYYDDETEEIVLILANGNEIRFSASELVNIYEGDGDTVVTYVDQETGANKIKVADAVINRLAAAEEGLSQEISDRQGADTLLQQAVALKADKTIAISDFIVSVNNTGTQLTFTLKDCNDTPVTKTTKIVNLPDAVVSGTLDNTNEKITLTLASSQTIDIDLGDLYDVLDALRTDVNANTNARHTHSNKATLDATQEAFTTALKNKIDGIESGAEVNIIETIEVNGSALTPSNKKISITIPVDTGDLTNNAGFITNSVNNLSNYYLKTETYTQTEINTLIAGITTITVTIVSSLPTASADTYFNTTKIIYLVRNSASSGNDYYEEYITVRTGTEGDYVYSWEKIGDTQIDLSNYYTKTETDSLLGAKQATIDSSHKLSADLVDDTSTTNKFVTATDKTTWNAKQNAITSSNKLSADLVDDTNATNKFVTATDITTWNNKQNALTFDDAPTSGSNNPVKSGGIYTALSGKQNTLVAGTNITIDPTTNTISASGGATITVDSSLSTTSENPVQNKVITNALNDKLSLSTTNNQTVISPITFEYDNSSSFGFITLTPGNGYLTTLAPDTTGLLISVIATGTLVDQDFIVNPDYIAPITHDNATDLGVSNYRWKNLYLGGQLRDGNNVNYGLVLPNTSSFTANKTIATTDQLPTVNNATLTVQLNGTTVESFTANASSNKTANIQALPNYSLSIGSTNGGNPRQVLFCSVNYTNFDSNSGAYFKLGAMSGHGNGSSYTFVEDIFINVNYQGTVTCQVYKYVQQTVTLDSVTRNYGDVFYTIDTTNKIVYFYILLGQYSSAQFTPGTKIGAAKAVTSANGIVQYTGTPTYYSSGTKVWATGDSATYVRSSDLATVATTGSYDDLSNKPTIPSAVTSINGLSGGSLTSPLVIKGGDATTAAKIALDQTASGQITNNGTQTLFGFTTNNATTLTIGHSSYAMALRGSGTRPTYNSNNLALYNDVPSIPTTTTAGKVLKSTSTAGVVEWGEAGGSSNIAFYSRYINHWSSPIAAARTYDENICTFSAPAGTKILITMQTRIINNPDKTDTTGIASIYMRINGTNVINEMVDKTTITTEHSLSYVFTATGNTDTLVCRLTSVSLSSSASLKSVCVQIIGANMTATDYTSS